MFCSSVFNNSKERNENPISRLSLFSISYGLSESVYYWNPSFEIISKKCYKSEYSYLRTENKTILGTNRWITFNLLSHIIHENFIKLKYIIKNIIVSI